MSVTVNFILKSKLDYKKNELPQFVEKMRSLVCEQQGEQCTGVENGNFEAHSSTEAEWFSMLPVERKQYISTRVKNTFLEDGQATGDVIDVEPATVVQSKPSTSADLTSEIRSGLSIDVKSFCHGINIPFQSLQGIWRKAEELLSSSDNLTPALGHGAAARMVRSTTAPGKGGRFQCDSECLHYKSLEICSHVVATAEVNNSLLEFSVYYRKLKKVPNFTDLAVSGMPVGRGRKGSVPPRKRKRQTPEYTV